MFSWQKYYKWRKVISQ